MTLKHSYTVFALVCIGLIRGYKLLISPFLRPRCRYLPTCSAYAIEAFQQYGVVKGGQLTLKRLCRCHPWGGHGVDPVPLPYIRSITKHNE